MFTIGQFAKIGNVSVRTLHYYDRIGLLNASSVDPSTGYREYQATQLQDLNRILALKDLGFSLAEIGELAASAVSGTELVGMLRLRQAEATRAAELESRRLERAGARITLLAEIQELDELSGQIVIKPLPSLRVALKSTYVEDYDREFGPILIPMYLSLDAEMTRHGLVQTGPSLTITTEQPDEGCILVEAAVPIDEDVHVPEGFDTRIVPSVARAATLVYAGDPAKGRTHTRRLTRWLELMDERGFDHYREVNIVVNPARMEECVLEMQAALDDSANALA